MKLLVIWEYSLIREGLRQILLQMDRDQVVLESPDFSHVSKLFDTHSDLSGALLNLNLPDIDGFKALKAMHAWKPNFPVVVFGDTEDENDIQRIIGAGARGFISLSRLCIEPEPLKMLNSALSRGIGAPRKFIVEATGTYPTKVGNGNLNSGCIYHRLTTRQHDVLELLKRGKSNKEIAQILNLAEGTVKIHCMAIYRELGVHNRTQAAFKAKQIFPDEAGAVVA